jgi:exopolysaccharide biosynthesis protein
LHKIDYPHADRLGLTVSDGEIVDYPDPLAPATFAITRDWRASMFASDAQTPTDNLFTAVSGFLFVLKNGNVRGGTDLEPRTGYGLCQDNRFLVLMTIDGRQSGYSEGAGRHHVGLWLRHFGSWNGINMDGGGSTTMALRDPSSGSISVVNQHSNHWLVGARRVGNNLGIYFIDGPEEIRFAD